jgi:hypothetical protein
MKTVFVLGAGASREAGGPLMSDFLDQAEKLLRAGLIEKDDRPAFDDVLNAISQLQSIHAKAYLNLDNFEILFGAVEMALLTGKLVNKSFDEITKLKSSLITLIVKTLEHTIAFPVKKADRGEPYVDSPRPFNFLAIILQQMISKSPIASGHEVSILTFNYDIALDYALTFANIPYDYGLSLDPVSEKLLVLKLHGSINWGVCQDCKLIVPIELSPVGLWSGYGEKYYHLRLSPQLPAEQHCGKPLSRTPMLIPPTWNKTGYHEKLAPVWQKAAQELAAAENIFIIGYSLPETDSFFRYLYALGSESNTRIKRFWVFNPDLDGSVKPRFEAMIGRGIENRFRFFVGDKGTFREAINIIGGALNET